MKVLVVKTSSLGDVIHTLPALSDAVAARPEIRFDWVIEEALAEICTWHPAVDQAITVNYRYWRHRALRGLAGGALRAFRERLRARRYDAVIDAQGLYKSGLITAIADGPRHGLDLLSCREKLAPLAYQWRHRVPRELHAIERGRRLFAAALGYPVPDSAPDYGLDPGRFADPGVEGPYLVFLHGTAWRSKRWPVERWRALAELAAGDGFTVCLPTASDEDRRTAQAIARVSTGARVLAPRDFNGMACLIAGASGVVAVDTGLGHLAAALGVPAVSLYGATGSDRTGTTGEGQIHLGAGMPCSPCRNKICNFTGNVRAPSPCMAQITESLVWEALRPGAEERRAEERRARQ